MGPSNPGAAISSTGRILADRSRRLVWVRRASLAAVVIGVAALIAGCGGSSQPTPQRADELLMSGTHYRSVTCHENHSGPGMNCVIIGRHGGRENCNERFYVKGSDIGIGGACFGDTSGYRHKQRKKDAAMGASNVRVANG